MVNLFLISSIFLLMKHVLLKTIEIVVSKLIRSRVLQVGGVSRGSKEQDGAKKIFIKTKPCGLGVKTPSFRPTPPRLVPLPSLLIKNCYIDFLFKN